MDVGTLLSVVQTVLGFLQCSELKELCSFFDSTSQLENLESTVENIKAMFKDVESVELSSEQRHWIEKLKYAVYDAQDLLDEFVTLAKQKKLMKGGKVTKKMRRLVSQFSSLGIARRLSQGVKEIRKRLDAIAADHKDFSIKLDCQPIRRRRKETCSYVYVQDIVGRGDDVEKIVRTLLDPDVGQKDVSFLPIVGIGGLGKTALTQLLFNDPRIVEAFPVRLWTCVADEDQTSLNVKATLCKILHAATGGNHEYLSMEHLQSKIQEVLARKKYFLVLDDVWNEKLLRWKEFAQYLMSGPKGSWIVVTTRSQKTATIVGGEHVYQLKGLSDEDSWHLFETTAFEQMHEQAHPSDLVGIGREIVKRCANVPLAIKVAGSLLYGQGKEKWQSFQNISLGRLKQGNDDGIEPILKFSYYQLESPLKICFAYCALFPKDHVIKKELLINLWMAQDYIVPLQEGQSIEDAGEEYFSILLKRCFFQDVKKDRFDDIISCKIHDLMHDIAQEVGGREIFVAQDFTTNLDDRIRHLSHFRNSGGTENSIARNKIRTFLSFGEDGWITLPVDRLQVPVNTLLKNWLYLRVLDLGSFGIESLPSALGNLIHLRYLELSYNSNLKVLPNSLTKLYNLQALKLYNCPSLKELPKDLSVLVNLRVLDVQFCFSLIGMPRGIGKLSSLQNMPYFLVGKRMTIIRQSIVDQMEDLKALTRLRGNLNIEILENAYYPEKNINEEGYLRGKQNLSGVCIMFPNARVQGEEHHYQEEEFLIDNLVSNSNVKELELSHYMGMRMLGRAMEESLPNLVRIKLYYCVRLQNLASLKELRYLKFLHLEQMHELEYMENTRNMDNLSDEVLLPCLEELVLQNMPKMKGWWREDGMIDSGNKLPSFPRVSQLTILYCPQLICIPTCPAIQDLKIWNSNNKLRIMAKVESRNSKLKRITNDDAIFLKSALSAETFGCLQEMTIFFDKRMESLSEIEEVFYNCSSCLQKLEIYECVELKSVSEGLKHLTALQELQLQGLPNLNLGRTRENEGEEDGMPWHCLQYNLRFLKLYRLPRMVSLPNGMHYLTTLERLELFNLPNLNLSNSRASEEGREGEGEGEEEDDMPWRGLQHNLRFLQLYSLPKIINLPNGMCYLTNLETLELISLPNLHLSNTRESERGGEAEEDDGMPWCCLQHSLRSLVLEFLPKLVTLPNGIRYLTNLQSLKISYCEKLELLSESVWELTSLKTLAINNCSNSLLKKCQNNTGEYWPYIQRIPHHDIF